MLLQNFAAGSAARFRNSRDVVACFGLPPPTTRAPPPKGQQGDESSLRYALNNSSRAQWRAVPRYTET
jgi:hypothetical protein